MNNREPMSFTVEINGVMFRVARRDDLKKASEGWPEPCYRNIPMTPLGYLLPGDHVAQQIMTAAGHDWGKIDTALPDDWVEDYERKHNGARPWACWSYEKDGDWAGSPLFMEDVYNHLDFLMKDAVWNRIYELVELPVG